MSEKKSEKHGKKQDTLEQSEIGRRFKQHPLLFIGTVLVLVIVIIAFVLVPAIVPGEGLSVSSLEFGYWDKKPINYSAGGFFARMREQYAALARYYGMSDYQIWRNAFESTVVRTAALDIMNESGYAPSKPFVDKKVAELPDFQENGRFSAVKYNKLDASSRIKLWQDMRNDIAVSLYHGDAETVKTASAEAEFIGQMALLQRKFKMTTFPYSSYPDEEIIAYANKNITLFKTLYLSQITISGDEREARAVLDRIRSNETSFEDAARTQSSDSYSERGGDTGQRMVFEVAAGIPEEEQRSPLYNLAKGETSDLVKIPSGWAIYRANEDAESPNLQDDAVLSKIRDYIMDNERGIIEDWLIGQAEDLSREARNSSFDGAAAEKGIEVYEFGALPINYGSSGLFTTVNSFSAPVLQDAVSDENFWRTAFSTPVGEPSQPVVLSGNGDNIVLLYPEAELEDSAAAETSESSFSGWWVANNIQQQITNTILSSNKFDDRFLSVYFTYLSN
ncbi:MAG: peptidylprolyl isomerase [Spirochaetaceae bacterium]|jgi:hypothetical protein|nr:peptidylprolyl isomerase [Spirochaetaceae bacterium]